MKIDSLNTLLLEELKDIYDFEKRLVKAIPKMAKAASSEELRSGLMDHLEVTRNQVARMEQVFQLLGAPAKGKPCAGMQGIIAEGEETIEQDGDETLLDVAIIGAAQRVEHYEMAAYAAARSIAEQLGNNEVADLLQETWDEESEADGTLAELATQMLSGLSNEAEEETANTGKSTKGAVKRSAGGSQSE